MFVAAAASACSCSGSSPGTGRGADANVDSHARADAGRDAGPKVDATVDALAPLDASRDTGAKADAHAWVDADRDALGKADSPARADAGPDAFLSPACDQTLLGYPLPPATTSSMAPRRPIVPFYQWENNDGYCGEVSLMQAAMDNGQWMSQFNARLLCGASVPGDGGRVSASQSGPDGWCVAHGHSPYEYAQLLFTCPSGCAAASTCLANARLDHEVYQTPGGQTGMSAYQSFMSWVKQKVIAGDWVAVGVLWEYGNDNEYNHIVSVTGIGTNHDPTDSSYYGDDVLFWDDHGLNTFEDGQEANNPAVPLGVVGTTGGCTPYIFSDSFDNLSRGRSDMPPAGNQPYAFPLPTANASNYAFAVHGPVDGDGETLPVTLHVTKTITDGRPNPEDPRAGYGYENPFIGTATDGSSCTNTPPASWMQVTAEVTVEGLTVGTEYNLYEYVFEGVSGIGGAAALAVPSSAFNANAGMATATTPFTAMATTYTTSVSFTSDKVVVFRAVAATSP